MGHYARNSFDLGWMPSADSFNAPPNSLLRMDNCVLDELGAVSLRQGSAKINSAAFSDTDVHSLFTATLNGTRYRMAGATAAVYSNGTSVASSLAGSGDVAFGSHMGQILFARSTTKKKYDGTTVRNWGIAAPGAAATLSALSSDSKTFGTFNGPAHASPDSPAWVWTEDDGTGAGYAAGNDAVANSAAVLRPNSTSGRGSLTKTFAAPTDFTVYDAAQTGTDEDLLDLYAYTTEPQYVSRIRIQVDVNGGNFQEDYYWYDFENFVSTDVTLTSDPDRFLAGDYTVEGYDRDFAISQLGYREQVQSNIRPDATATNVQWNRFSIARGKMNRFGSTAGMNWSTVRAIRVVVEGIAGGSAAAVRFDDWKILGGAQRQLTGRYAARVVAVRNDGTYQALSAPSAVSAEIEVKAQGIRLTLASGTVNALDSQVNELWAYVMGGSMQSFYRATVKTGGPFSGAQTIDITSSERTILIANQILETDNAVPPDTIIGIEGPHYDRTLCLTATHLYPSRQRNPDSYAAGEVVRVGDAAETALWIKKLNEQLYVGTTRDVYRIDGDWTVLPDGSLNIVKRPLGVTRPPISSVVTVGTVNNADVLVYLASDGWRVLGGPLLTDGSVDLLYRGYNRHDVLAVNIADTAARFRCAISKNVLFAVTPEGSSTTTSTVIHAYHFRQQRWYRFTYTPSWRSLYTEPDGTLIAGDNAGFIRTLDHSTKQDDGANIPVVVWTPFDDNREPFTYKDAQNLLIRLDTGDVTATISFHVNGSAAANASITTDQEMTDTGSFNISHVDQFTQMSLRLTGSFNTFTLRSLRLTYLDNPLPLLLHDTNFIDLSEGLLQWVRHIRVKAKSAVDMTLTPYWDGTAGTARTITVGTYAGKPYVFEVPLSREDKGRTARVVITTPSPSHVYWVEFSFATSGKSKQKRYTFKPDEAAA